MRKAFLIVTFFLLVISNRSSGACIKAISFLPKDVTDSAGYVLRADQGDIKEWKDTPYYYKSKLRTCRYALIPVVLTNTTHDTLKYIEMSCSKFDIFTTDTNYVKIFQNLQNCFKNTAITLTLAPYGSMRYEVPVYVFNDDARASKTLTPKSFKIGVGLFRHDYKFSRFPDISYMMVHERGNVLWSNAVTVL